MSEGNENENGHLVKLDRSKFNRNLCSNFIGKATNQRKQFGQLVTFKRSIEAKRSRPKHSQSDSDQSESDVRRLTGFLRELHFNYEWQKFD